jgi:parvulin-like peptidyl-prolyl isomerase
MALTLRQEALLLDVSRPDARRSMVFLATGALIGLLIAGYGLFTAKGTRSHAVPAEAVALINGRPILRSDFMTQVQTQFATPFAQSTREQRRKVLQDMLAEELQVQRGLEIDLPSFDPDVRTALVAGVELEVSADVLAQQPSESQLRDYYTAHEGQYVSDGRVRMRDLIIRGREQDAQQAVAALRAGTALEQVMQRYELADSGRLLDSGHVDTGEIFEFAARARLSPEVYAAAVSLQGGQISDPIQLSDGIHVVVMLEHRMPVLQDYATVADKVWGDYKSEAQRQVQEANMSYLRGRADILLASDAP